jgi:hypothetical protein
MKRHVFMAALVILMMSGCGVSRRVVKQDHSESRDSTHVEAVKTDSKDIFIDTTKTESGKVTITEITFFPDAGKQSDTTANVPVENDNNAPIELELPGGGKVKGKGSIQSVRQTVIETMTEEKGESRETEKSEESESHTSVAAAVNDSSQEKVTEAPKPNHLKYAFYILALAVVVLMYLKRVPILNFIKRILAGVRKIVS